MKEYSVDELLQKAAAYCSIAEHCVSEVDSKLTTWGGNAEARQKIICHLQEEGFIDEQRYCKAFVNDKIRYAKWGKIKIAYMLRGKQIEEAYITEALQNVDENSYQQTLLKLLETKKREIHCEGYEKQLKLYRFAQARGFENSVINQILKDIK